MPPTGPFGGVSSFHPLTPCFCLSLQICKLPSYSQTRSPAAAGSVPTSYIGPMGGVGATHGNVRGLFRVLTL